MDEREITMWVRGALAHYYDLEFLSNSPLNELTAVATIRSEYTARTFTRPPLGWSVQSFLDQALGNLIRPGTHNLLVARYLHEKSIKDLCAEIHLQPAALHQKINRAFEELVSIIISLELNAQSNSITRRYELLEHVPPHHHGSLSGIDSGVSLVLDLIREQYRHATMPLVVTGIGGIGKTTLIAESVYRWIERDQPLLKRVLWLQVLQSKPQQGIEEKNAVIESLIGQLVRQLSLPPPEHPLLEQQLQQVAYVLNEARYLLVLDNVETESEEAAVLTIYRILGRTTLPILVGSRRTPSEFALDAYRIPVRELSLEDATHVVRQEYWRLTQQPIADADIQAIIKKVGGHPLALKLVTAQCQLFPVEHVLETLVSPSSLAAHLFSPIYERAWEMLSPLARDVLISLNLLPLEGTSWSGIQQLARVTMPDAPLNDIDEVIRALVKLNLLQVSAHSRPRYSMHRLTYRYLEQRAGWE
jgi:GTPase SAR1 family protein